MTHTPAQTAEERAKAIMSTDRTAHDLAAWGMDDATISQILAPDRKLEALIASAITQAEDDAYERAAVTLGNPLTSGGFSLEWVCGFAEGQKRSADVVRSLKSQKETP